MPAFGQSDTELHPATQCPDPSQTVPPFELQGVPVALLDKLGFPAAQFALTQSFGAVGTSLSSLATTQVPPLHTAFLQSPTGPCGQSESCRQWTQVPLPSHTVPPFELQVVPVGFGTKLGVPAAQVALWQSFVALGTSESSTAKPQTPELQTAL